MEAIQIYDPHLLYHAINITVELKYRVAMQKVYHVLSVVDKNNQTLVNKITPDDVMKLLDSLGDGLENLVSDEASGSGSTLQEKIKELLRLLGCNLSNQELNNILKGNISLDDALSQKARTAWLIIFEKDRNGRYSPSQEIVNQLLNCSQQIALENINIKIQRHMEDKRLYEARVAAHNNGYVIKNENIKMANAVRENQEKKREREDPLQLEKKRTQLKLYIAHMQGYDRDRDRDGGRGIDMNTGEVIDYGDIYIADKGNYASKEEVVRDSILDESELHDYSDYEMELRDQTHEQDREQELR